MYTKRPDYSKLLDLIADQIADKVVEKLSERHKGKT
jgi:hypothetical protein